MESSLIIYILIIFLCLLFSAFFSISEAAFISVNRLKIKSLIEKGDTRAKAVKHIFENHDKLFSAVIFASNMANVASASAGTALAIEMIRKDYAPVVATAVMTLLVVIFGELAPKTFAVSHAEATSLKLARPIDFFIRLVNPVVWIINMISNLIIRLFGAEKKKVASYITEEEIKAIINIGEKEGTLEEEEKEMLHKVFEFGDKVVAEAMVPRTEIVAVSENDTIADVFKLVAKKGYSRYPVIKDSIDNVIGILYIKDILIKMAEEQVSMDTPIARFKREAYYIPENKMIRELLEEMQQKKFQIAIIVDEYGGTEGLITLEDLMELLVGSLQDEFEEKEEQKEVEVVDENTFIVSGQMSLDELSELLGTEISSENFNTIGGFLFGMFGRLPNVGEQIRYQNLKFLILEMEGKKISLVKVTKL
ncbi:MAG: HlyC/CorC family transporter [Nitrospirae bacterium]|nr:MAG: HlyC/CorC family transporter [Nitrospirota bacterium]